MLFVVVGLERNEIIASIDFFKVNPTDVTLVAAYSWVGDQIQTILARWVKESSRTLQLQ